ncbi:hypothetical protein SDC9_103100 [bioreactor metagenome]|uniref:Uncharacterized protein n=1 Tax=bioreactor metagenome TaxID=1076179 RepID=A0A645AU60_9ZZZZ
MADFRIAGTVDQARGSVIGIRLRIAPITITGYVVELAAHHHVAGRSPLGGQLGPAILKADAAVGDVVVALTDRRVLHAIDQRRAKVAHRLLQPLRVRQLKAQILRHVPAQSARYRAVAGVATVHPSVGLVTTDVQAIRPLLVDCAATAKGQRPLAAGAKRGLQLIGDLAARGLLGDHIDHATNRSVAVDHRSRSAQYLDAVDGPGIKGKAHPYAAILARSVIQAHHG